MGNPERKYLTIDIEYNIKTDEHEISGDINDAGVKSVLETWIMGQVNTGKDESPAENRDVYHIQIVWYPEDDTIKCSHDCGNKGLREGILMTVFSRISND